MLNAVQYAATHSDERGYVNGDQQVELQDLYVLMKDVSEAVKKVDVKLGPQGLS